MVLIKTGSVIRNKSNLHLIVIKCDLHILIWRNGDKQINFPHSSVLMFLACAAVAFK